jgi:hypothetical protein
MRPAVIGHPAGGNCLARQVAGFGHAFRAAATAPGQARAIRQQETTLRR